MADGVDTALRVAAATVAVAQTDAFIEGDAGADALPAACVGEGNELALAAPDCVDTAVAVAVADCVASRAVGVPRTETPADAEGDEESLLATVADARGLGDPPALDPDARTDRDSDGGAVVDGDGAGELLAEADAASDVLAAGDALGDALSERAPVAAAVPVARTTVAVATLDGAALSLALTLPLGDAESDALAVVLAEPLGERVSAGLALGRMVPPAERVTPRDCPPERLALTHALARPVAEKPRETDALSDDDGDAAADGDTVAVTLASTESVAGTEALRPAEAEGDADALTLAAGEAEADALADADTVALPHARAVAVLDGLRVAPRGGDGLVKSVRVTDIDADALAQPDALGELVAEGTPTLADAAADAESDCIEENDETGDAVGDALAVARTLRVGVNVRGVDALPVGDCVGEPAALTLGDAVDVAVGELLEEIDASVLPLPLRQALAARDGVALALPVLDAERDAAPVADADADVLALPADDCEADDDGDAEAEPDGGADADARDDREAVPERVLRFPVAVAAALAVAFLVAAALGDDAALSVARAVAVTCPLPDAAAEPVALALARAVAVAGPVALLLTDAEADALSLPDGEPELLADADALAVGERLPLAERVRAALARPDVERVTSRGVGLPLGEPLAEPHDEALAQPESDAAPVAGGERESAAERDADALAAPLPVAASLALTVRGAEPLRVAAASLGDAVAVVVAVRENVAVGEGVAEPLGEEESDALAE